MPVKSFNPLIVSIHSSGRPGVVRAGWRESNERSFLSLRIKRSESDLSPTGLTWDTSRAYTLYMKYCLRERDRIQVNNYP